MLKQRNVARLGRQGGKALFAFAARGLQQASTLVITLLAARFLSPAEYGVYCLAAVFLVLAQTMTYTGFYQFMLTARDDDQTVLSTCFWLILGLASAASSLLALAAWPLQALFQAEQLGPVLAMLALVQPLASLGAWSSAALLRRGAIMCNFGVMFVQNLVALIGGAVLLWCWHSLYALVAFRLLRVLTGTVLYAVLGRDRPSRTFDRALARRAIAFSGGLYGSRLLGFLARYAADLLLGLVQSPAAVGLYRFGNRVATGATDIINQPMANFAATRFGSAARRNVSLATPLAVYAGTATLLAGLAGAVIIVFARDGISLLFRPAYAAAVEVTYAMALRGAAGIGALLLEPAFAALGRTRWVLWFDAVSTLAAIAAILAASPLGLVGLAWTQALLTLGTTAWAFLLLRHRGRIETGPAVRNFIGATMLSTGYGVILATVQELLVRPLAPDGLSALAIGLVAAAALAFPALMLGRRLRLFSLQAFSG